MSETTGSAGQRLAQDMADVVRDEVHAVRTDSAEVARPATAGLLLIGAAAGCTILGIGAALATSLRILAPTRYRRTWTSRRAETWSVTRRFVAATRSPAWSPGCR